MKDLLPDRPIAFNRDFVRLGIGVKGALFLSQAIYWEKRTTTEDGSFWKTIDEWEEETGLTKHEQLSVKKELENKGFITVEKRGLPAKNYFHVHKYAIQVELYPHVDDKKSDMRTTSSLESGRHSLYTETTTESDATEVAEVHPFYGFPIDEYENDSFVDETGAYIPQLKDEYGRIFTKTQLNKMKKEYEQSLKQEVSSAKRKETMNDTAKEMVQILKDVQGISRLDGSESYKYANSLKTAFLEHLVRDMKLSPDMTDTELTGQFKLFLERIKTKSEFHFNNATSMAYLNRNFNKIIREIK